MSADLKGSDNGAFAAMLATLLLQLLVKKGLLSEKEVENLVLSAGHAVGALRSKPPKGRAVGVHTKH